MAFCYVEPGLEVRAGEAYFQTGAAKGFGVFGDSDVSVGILPERIDSEFVGLAHGEHIHDDLDVIAERSGVGLGFYPFDFAGDIFM